MKLYHFDGIDEQLALLPMAARRALDVAGIRLSRESWSSLPHASRRSIVELGAAVIVDIERVRELAANATPAPESIPPLEDPRRDNVPTDVRDALGPDRPLPDAAWAALTPLDRYAITKVSSRGQADRIEGAYTEIIGHSALSSHLAPNGGVRMVDVGEKPVSQRMAAAESVVTMSAEAFARLESRTAPKGDVLSTARLAGIMAAKRTAELIPLCHSIALTRVTVDFEPLASEHSVRIVATAEAHDRTGVEMEAMVAVSTAALTIYDMLKSLDRAMTIGPTRLVSKSGGRSGEFRR